MRRLSRAVLECHRGATAVEYGLVVALIVIAMVSALGTLASNTTGMWNTVRDRVANAS